MLVEKIQLCVVCGGISTCVCGGDDGIGVIDDE